jgi:hypothetical protein
MAETNDGKCAYPGCECSVANGEQYCSDYCERVGDRASIACECGHGECAVEEMTGAAGSPA